MSLSRIFQNCVLITGSQLELDAQASHHLAKVLRAKVGDQLVLFNGQGGEYAGIIAAIRKKFVSVAVGDFSPREVESALPLVLVQGISRGEKMDYTIQKAVELGVTSIIPVFTERCNVKLDAERRQKKAEHWQSIAVSACEQSTRNYVPTVATPCYLTEWLRNTEVQNGLVLSPYGTQTLRQVEMVVTQPVYLLIGPEGGLSDAEIQLAIQYSFIPLNLGPRILRTETAAVAALAALQCLYGDLS